MATRKHSYCAAIRFFSKLVLRKRSASFRRQAANPEGGHLVTPFGISGVWEYGGDA